MWLSSFLACSIGKMFLTNFGFNYRKSGALVSTIFQMNFLYSTFKLLISSGNQEETVSNLQDLYGYFVYDIVDILMSDNTEKLRMYIIHHCVTCMAIDTVTGSNLENTTFYINLVCFAAELSSPLINTRVFFNNKKLLIHVYFISRVVVLPIASALFLWNLNASSYTVTVLGSSIGAIYISTLIWFSKLLKN